MNRFALMVLFVSSAVLGCASNANDVPRGPVKGRVTLGGKAVANSTIVFESSEAGVSQTASTDGDGNYEFAAYQAKGLPAASYRVSVVPGRFMKPGEELLVPDITKPVAPPQPLAEIPQKYKTATTSGLTADVKANSNPPFNFALEP